MLHDNGISPVGVVINKHRRSVVFFGCYPDLFAEVALPPLYQSNPVLVRQWISVGGATVIRYIPIFILNMHNRTWKKETFRELRHLHVYDLWP